mgnify:CR=1 FL=1|tara:strand:- start:46873 stop:47340 length:468 start_codon:yes stop_codon:yes gene_type:complete
MEHPKKATLLAFYENTTSKKLDARLNSHLEECESCQRVLKQFMLQDKYLTESESELALEVNQKDELFSSVFSIMDSRQEQREIRKEKLNKKIETGQRLKQGASKKLEDWILSPVMGLALSLILILFLTIKQSRDVEYKKNKVFELQTMTMEGGAS